MPPIGQLPPLPDMAQAAEWIVQAAGVVERAQIGWAANADCMARLRKDGVIR